MKKPMPLPADVRLMNIATALLVTAFVLLTLGGWAWWLIRHPSFALQTITVQGDVNRNNAFAFRTQVLPKLEGNFFTIDLAKARLAFEAVPWVRVAVVHRDFPNRLRAVLLEHRAMALWGDEDAGTLINEQGQVFEATLDDVDAERLPRMKGPATESQTVAVMYVALSPRFQALDMEIDLLELTPRGSWRVQTKQGDRSLWARCFSCGQCGSAAQGCLCLALARCEHGRCGQQEKTLSDQGAGIKRKRW